MTSNYVMVSIKLFHDVGNDQFIILCNFSGRILIWKPTFIEHFFNHTSTSPSKRIDLWLRENGRNNAQYCWANNVGTCSASWEGYNP